MCVPLTISSVFGITSRLQIFPPTPSPADSDAPFPSSQMPRVYFVKKINKIYVIRRDIVPLNSTIILMTWNFSDALLLEGNFMIAFSLLLSPFFILQPQQHSCYFIVSLIATLTHVTTQGSSAYDLPWIFLFGLVKMACNIRNKQTLKNQIGIQLQALHVTFKCIMTTLKGQASNHLAQYPHE